MKETILDEAARITSGDRQQAYGHPYDNHGRTAAMFAAYKGIPFSREDVIAFNIIQKLSRNFNQIKRDNYTDIAGFARNGEMIMEREYGEKAGDQPVHRGDDWVSGLRNSRIIEAALARIEARDAAARAGGLPSESARHG